METNGASPACRLEDLDQNFLKLRRRARWFQHGGGNSWFTWTLHWSTFASQCCSCSMTASSVRVWSKLSLAIVMHFGLVDVLLSAADLAQTSWSSFIGFQQMDLRCGFSLKNFSRRSSHIAMYIRMCARRLLLQWAHFRIRHVVSTYRTSGTSASIHASSIPSFQSISLVLSMQPSQCLAHPAWEELFLWDPPLHPPTALPSHIRPCRR